MLSKLQKNWWLKMYYISGPDIVKNLFLIISIELKL